VRRKGDGIEDEATQSSPDCTAQSAIANFLSGAANDPVNHTTGHAEDCPGKSTCDPESGCERSALRLARRCPSQSCK